MWLPAAICYRLLHIFFFFGDGNYSDPSSLVMEIIYTNISDPYSSTICDNKYFITFINDFSRYGYLYLIKEKFETLEKFKILKNEVEK